MVKKTRLAFAAVVLAGIVLAGHAADPQPREADSPRPPVIKNLSHPGLTMDYDDMARIRRSADYGVDPWKMGLDNLRKRANPDYVLAGPYAHTGRGEGENDRGGDAFRSESMLAYACAVMWVITGRQAYADKAIEVLNAWTGTLRTIGGKSPDMVVVWFGWVFINAAEIIRYTDAGWREADIEQAERFFREVFAPVIREYRGGPPANKDTSINKMKMAIAVFLDDRAMFDEAVRFFRLPPREGRSDGETSKGPLARNILPSGQNWESARDQGHTQIALGGLAEACEVAWKQGIDLYSELDNRLLRGFEYTAKYNLGYDDLPPFVRTWHGDRISAVGRGNFRPIYEMVYNHYKYRAGLPDDAMKYTKMVVDKVRAEGGEGASSVVLGHGTLIYNRQER